MPLAYLHACMVCATSQGHIYLEQHDSKHAEYLLPCLVMSNVRYHSRQEIGVSLMVLTEDSLSCIEKSLSLLSCLIHEMTSAREEMQAHRPI